MVVYIGLDASLASTAVCVLGEKGKMVTDAQVASSPDALALFLRELPYGIAAIGLEAGPLSNWLYTSRRRCTYALFSSESRSDAMRGRATWRNSSVLCFAGRNRRGRLSSVRKRIESTSRP